MYSRTYLLCTVVVTFPLFVCVCMCCYVIVNLSSIAPVSLRGFSSTLPARSPLFCSLRSRTADSLSDRHLVIVASSGCPGLGLCFAKTLTSYRSGAYKETSSFDDRFVLPITAFKGVCADVFPYLLIGTVRILLIRNRLTV